MLLVEHGKICAACNKTGRGLRVCPLVHLKSRAKRKKASDSILSGSIIKDEKFDTNAVDGDQKSIIVKVEMGASDDAIGVTELKEGGGLVAQPVQQSRPLKRQKRR